MDLVVNEIDMASLNNIKSIFHNCILPVPVYNFPIYLGKE